MTPEFLPAAQEELAAAVKIGDARAAGRGLELLLETQRVVALLCDLPEVGEPLDERYRRIPLWGFPFGAYQVECPRLQIIAFAHRRQRPGYWAPRK